MQGFTEASLHEGLKQYYTSRDPKLGASMLRRTVSSILAIPFALAFAACSTPPPTPAAGGVSMSLTPAGTTVGGTRNNCTAGTSGSFTYSIGDPTPHKTVEDGTDGVSVSCTVKDDGTFSASIGGKDPNINSNINFTFTGTVNQNDEKTPASNPSTMTFYSPQTLHINTLDGYPACTLSNISVYKAGAMLADIDCPIIGDSEGSTGCKVHGTMAFEYCLTGKEQN
jgi:hypothetical protein